MWVGCGGQCRHQLRSAPVTQHAAADVFELRPAELRIFPTGSGHGLTHSAGLHPCYSIVSLNNQVATLCDFLALLPHRHVCRCVAQYGPSGYSVNVGNREGGQFDRLGRAVKRLLDALVSGYSIPATQQLPACQTQHCSPCSHRRLSCLCAVSKLGFKSVHLQLHSRPATSSRCSG
jgi:hypothetical protein